jgi:hypothetical protein
MNSRCRILLLAAIGYLVVSFGARPALFSEDAKAPEPLKVTHKQNTDALTPYDVFEITFTHENDYASPFFDVTIDVTFKSPSGKETTIGGFFYGSLEPPKITTVRNDKGPERRVYSYAKHNTWKARFAPAELGQWKYSYAFTNKDGQKAEGAGEFKCVEGRVKNHGFVRVNPDDKYRFVFDDGTPYYPIGFQDGFYDSKGLGTLLAAAAMEGPFRNDGHGKQGLPEGAMYKPGPSNNPLNQDVCFRRFSQSGFNMFRTGPANNLVSLYDDLDHYKVHEARMMDELLQMERKYRMRPFYGIFGSQYAFQDKPENKEAMEKVKRFIKYSVDRWGAYVDVWEFFNEQKVDTKWYEQMVPYLKSIDPYHHPVTTSWERPEIEGIDINAPHWYDNEDRFRSDAITAERTADWKKRGKPVIVGEQGNYTDQKVAKPGEGGVWDIFSAQRMRQRIWSSFFNEISLVFWNTSYAKDGHNMNIWLGPKERQYVAALQDFAYCLDKGIRMAAVEVSDPKAARAYGLASKDCAAVYLHHFANHDNAVSGLKVTLNVPKAAKAYWYSPEDGSILASVDAPAGKQTFTAPDFVVDLALLITAGNRPDHDKDGKPNDVDDDDDNDGVPDKQDAFPLEPEETQDKDGDMIGDVIDADDNGDGIGDDENKNGIPDNEEMDIDGDGVPKSGAVPWDAFPWDPKEWRDTDGDGIGDNSDPDIDGDGWTNEEEKKAGTDPLDPLSFPH